METLTLQSEIAEWETIAPFMAMVANGSEREVNRIKREVESGAVAYSLLSATSGETVGAYVVKIEGDLLELVAAGANPGLSLTGKVLPAIEAKAKLGGLKGVLVCTYRRGMVEKLAEAGYGSSYVAMLKEF